MPILTSPADRVNSLDADLESWQLVFRRGVAPSLTLEQLERLRLALDMDDSRLIQGATTSPPPLQCMLDCHAEGCCPISLASGLETVGEVSDFFARVCQECDRRLGEDAAVRWLLTWWDDGDRDAVRERLLWEVELVISLR